MGATTRLRSAQKSKVLSVVQSSLRHHYRGYKLYLRGLKAAYQLLLPTKQKPTLLKVILKVSTLLFWSENTTSNGRNNQQLLVL
jgi:hypothetical protein